MDEVEIQKMLFRLRAACDFAEEKQYEYVKILPKDAMLLLEMLEEQEETSSWLNEPPVGLEIW